MKRTSIAAAVLMAMLTAVSAYGQEGGTAGRGSAGPGYGPGVMGGYGPGGYGPGMMGPGGYGPGPGMMGGYGGGPGAGYGPGGAYALPGLSDEQRERIAAIQEENRNRNWQTMGQLRAEQFKLRRMYYSDQLDADAYTAQQAKVDELRRQLVRSQIETRRQIEGTLTPEQRQQFRRFGPRWLEPEA